MKSIQLRVSERPVSCIQYNREGDLLFTAGHDGLVCAFNAKTGDRIGTYHFLGEENADCKPEQLPELLSERISKAVFWLDVNADSTQLAVAIFDRVVIFDVVTGAYIDSIDVEAKLERIEWAQNPMDQDKLLLCYSTSHANHRFPGFQVWERKVQEENGTKVWENTLYIHDFEGKPTICAWGPLDQSIIGATDQGKILQWDLNKVLMCSVMAHKNSVTDIAFNKDRSIMLSTSKDQTATLLQVPTFEIMKKYVSDRPINSAALSPLMEEEDLKLRKPHFLLAGGQDAEDVALTGSERGCFETLIMNIYYENEVARIMAHYSPVNCVRYAPDGKAFATAAVEGNVKLYELDDKI